MATMLSILIASGAGTVVSELASSGVGSVSLEGSRTGRRLC